MPSPVTTSAERRRAVLVRLLVVLAGVAVLAASFAAVVSASSTGIRWLAGAIAAVAVFATIVAAVRLFVAISHLLEPPGGQVHGRNGAGPSG